MPDDRPIYFSVDWDADSSDWAAIDAALRGAASVIGADRVGVYGSYATVAHCHAAGTAKWFWMTYAWSKGKEPPAYVHLYQYRNTQNIGGADCDFVRALKDDYGQWGVDMAVQINTDDIAAIGNEVARQLRTWVEEDPDSTTDPKGTGRVGGWIRMSNQRDRERFEALLAAVNGDDDVSAIVAGVLAGLDADAIAERVVAALPADEAEKTAQAIIDKIAAANSSAQQTGQ
jgi:hypothetical protein